MVPLIVVAIILLALIAFDVLHFGYEEGRLFMAIELGRLKGVVEWIRESVRRPRS